jgi:hypothetical protein
MIGLIHRPLLLVSILVVLIQIQNVEGQFGVSNNKQKDQRTATVTATHPADTDDVATNTQQQQQQQQQETAATLDFDVSKYQEAATQLQIKAPNLDAQDALDLAVLLDAAVQDPETKIMVENLRTSGSSRLEAFEDSTTQAEMVMGLKQTLDELKALEYLFQDPARAVLEMHKDGMIDEKRIDYYRKNPEELANDTRKGLYFSFVSLAVAAGII